MLPLILAAVACAPPPEPRLQWAYDGGRVVYQYDGKWAHVTPASRTAFTEVSRTADFIELKDAAGAKSKLKATEWPPAGKPGRWVRDFPITDLGKLSEKYESGGRGPGTVSTGVGDPGGVSYGSYQLASKMGRADQFVKKHYPTEFAGLSGGTPAFTTKWKDLAKADPAGLHEKEHAFIRETHFDPQVKKLKKDLNLDVTTHTRVFQDAVWSSAVHHGPNTDAIVVSVKPLLAGPMPPTEIEMLKAIYAERGRKTADGKLARFKGVSPEWVPGLTKRFTNELADAVGAMEGK